MRSGSGFGIAALCVGLVLGVVFAQEKDKEKEKPKETTTTAQPAVTQPPSFPRIDVDNIWRYQYEGKKRKGQFLEIVDPEGEEGGGRTLVVTQLEVRMRVTMRARLVNHRRTAKKKFGRHIWAKEIIRSELFSLGWLDGTSKYMSWTYSGWVGIRFPPGTRMSLEFRQGGGDLAIYAEGYWVGKKS